MKRTIHKRVRIRRLRFPRGAELRYRAQLRAHVRHMREAIEPGVLQLVSHYQKEDEQLSHDGQLFDASNEGRKQTILQRVRSLVHKYVQRESDLYAPKLAKEIASSIGVSVSTTMVRAIKQGTGIDVRGSLMTPKIVAPLRPIIAENISLIKSLPSGYAENLTGKIIKGFAEGQRWQTLAETIKSSGHVTESRADLIARDQTGKMTAAYSEAMQKSLGGRSYIWQTSGDELVRPTHAENEGQEFSWDDPPEETGHPGNDVNCRCTAVPVFDLEELNQRATLHWEGPEVLNTDPLQFSSNPVPQ